MAHHLWSKLKLVAIRRTCIATNDERQRETAPCLELTVGLQGGGTTTRLICRRRPSAGRATNRPFNRPLRVGWEDGDESAAISEVGVGRNHRLKMRLASRRDSAAGVPQGRLRRCAMGPIATDSVGPDAADGLKVSTRSTMGKPPPPPVAPVLAAKRGANFLFLRIRWSNFLKIYTVH